MQNWKRVLGTASLCAVMLGGNSLALASDTPVSNQPVLISAPVSTGWTGTVSYIDLEGGFYSVDGYRLIGDQQLFEQYLNLQVQVTGSIFDGVSVQMVKAIEVDEIKLLPTQTLVGELTRVDLEGGYFAVNGIRLVGDDALFEQYLGQSVQVTGSLVDAASIQMVKAVQVDQLTPVEPEQPGGLQPVQAKRTLPLQVTWNGEPIHFSQSPRVVDGILMLPLRDLVKAVGGSVQWHGPSRTITVEMPDRMAYFISGEIKAEMNENNVRYFQRNLIAMAAAPANYRGHVYISADAVSSILGLLEADGQSDTMQLSTQSPGAAKLPADSWGSLFGVVQELGDAAAPAILISGSPLSNGEAGLVWATITADTAIMFAGDAEAAASFADLAAGQNVIVDMAGPMLMSYPGRVAAARIIIERPTTETLTGTIRQIETGTQTRVLLESGKMSNGEANLIWLRVDAETKISWYTADSKRLGLVTDLAAGQEIEVTLSGPIMESYPAQGGASAITIVKA